MDYKILQIPRDRLKEMVEKEHYCYLDYEMAKQNGFSVKNYKVIYEGQIEKQEGPIENTLEDLFVLFNESDDRPTDFKGHSLSVGDLVELDGKTYFVDFVGYSEVKEDK